MFLFRISSPMRLTNRIDDGRMKLAVLFVNHFSRNNRHCEEVRYGFLLLLVRLDILNARGSRHSVQTAADAACQRLSACSVALKPQKNLRRTLR